MPRKTFVLAFSLVLLIGLTRSSLDDTHKSNTFTVIESVKVYDLEEPNRNTTCSQSATILTRIGSTIFSFICHQDPGTLVKVNDQYIPLCPRCIGLHTGLFLSFVCSVLHFRGPLESRMTHAWPLVIACMGISVLEWSLANLGITDSTATSRMLSGLIGGSACGILLQKYVSTQLTRTQTTSSRDRPGLLVLIRSTTLSTGILFITLLTTIPLIQVLTAIVILNFALLLVILLARISFLAFSFLIKTPFSYENPNCKSI